ncbi:MAG: YhbY family RNA-binding protein [Candidatus Izimaplasma sp.]|nr:YhbY family RNA-binding protein [Candidatus Izimaplasma bacterium]
MNLKGKQKAKLRRLANERPIMFQIGQAGITKSVINNIIENLDKHEVGRVSVLKNCPDSFEKVIDELTKSGIYVIYKIGHVLLLYKANPKLKDRIRL